MRSLLVTWHLIKVLYRLRKLDLTQCHLSRTAISDPYFQTACLWVSAFLRLLSVCPQSERITAIASCCKPRRLPACLDIFVFERMITVVGLYLVCVCCSLGSADGAATFDVTGS